MACKNAYRRVIIRKVTDENTDKPSARGVDRLLFGVDSAIFSGDLLQNNIDHFEWVVRNKVYPNFWGRNITGENCLTKEEIKFLHNKGCKIAAIFNVIGTKDTEENGKKDAKEAGITAFELGIPEEAAIFLEVKDGELVTRNYLRGFAKALMAEGYTPGFKTSTDAKYDFDREYSRGMQTNKDIFEKCLIWATSPTLAEYDRITTTHRIRPDNWHPFAPSGITRNEIAIWEYGKDCHPIYDDEGNETTFNVNLVRNKNVIIEKMF